MDKQEQTYIMRIVPEGLPAVNWNDEDECDLDKPCDLVLIRVVEHDGCKEEIEHERKTFSSGHGASSFLCDVLRRAR